MPQDQGACMRNQIGFIRWQHGAQVAQILKLAEVGKWSFPAIFDGYCKSRMVFEDAEKNQILIVYYIFDVLALEQNRFDWLSTDKTLLAPYRNEATVVAFDSLTEPVGVLAPLTTSVDKRPGKYVVVFHPAIRLPV